METEICRQKERMKKMIELKLEELKNDFQKQIQEKKEKLYKEADTIFEKYLK
jgi:hypothetical protein